MSQFIKFFFTSMLNMFRTLLHPSSGRSLRLFCCITTLVVCWSFSVAGLGWYPCVRLKHTWSEQTSCASACNMDTTPTQPHRNSNTHRTMNNTTNVVIQQNSCKLLMILLPATRIPLQPNHTETRTHIEPRTIRPMW